jgi:hypothetical protein
MCSPLKSAEVKCYRRKALWRDGWTAETSIVDCSNPSTARYPPQEPAARSKAVQRVVGRDGAADYDENGPGHPRGLQWTTSDRAPSCARTSPSAAGTRGRRCGTSERVNRRQCQAGHGPFAVEGEQDGLDGILQVLTPVTAAFREHHGPAAGALSVLGSVRHGVVVAAGWSLTPLRRVSA